MSLTISKDALHYKFYKWAYDNPKDRFSNNEPPTNLCPYFWAVVLAVILTPLWLIPKTAKRTPGLHKIYEVSTSSNEPPVLSGFLTLAFLLVAVVIIAITSLAAIAIWSASPLMAVTIGLGLVALGVVFPTGIPSLAWSYVVSTYKKVCPTITWG